VLPRNSLLPHADRKCYTTGRIREMSGNITVQSLPKHSTYSTFRIESCCYWVVTGNKKSIQNCEVSQEMAVLYY